MRGMVAQLLAIDISNLVKNIISIMSSWYYYDPQLGFGPPSEIKRRFRNIIISSFFGVKLKESLI